MMWPFYLMALVAIVSTVRVVTNTNPVHALLSLIVSLLAVAGIFMIVGAPFAGALEIIVYAGAIMVLFVFVVMMLNLGKSVVEQERKWLQPRFWIGPAILSLVLLIVLVYAISSVTHGEISGEIIGAKEVGISLFGPYILAVELASVLLLSGLIVAYHIGRDQSHDDLVENEKVGEPK